MDVILHLGAHRTASTSFQAYMRGNTRVLQGQGIGFWGPQRTRGGLLTGVIPVRGAGPAERQYLRASGRIALACEKSARAGIRQLVVSDENMIGAPRANLRADSLYPQAGARVRRYLDAFGGGVTQIALSIRSPELYWASCFAFAVMRGHAVPSAATLNRLTDSPRGWREVIADIACAAPGVPLMILTHEEFGSLPELRLWHMTGRRADPPDTHAREWLNRSPGLGALRAFLGERGEDPDLLPEGTGRWMPFARAAQAELKERYADDLFWLRAGADGLARLADTTGWNSGQDGTQPPPGIGERGRRNDEEVGRMVGHR
ncbi:hypothetical protein ATO6_09015 [Oceanicola sp. 22II-s10i]|uniref:hypothetical protein n=1 Tax=Oceanicola sp. 22II-s10i TaxID=1317116 RepID=UPI000B5241D5|nr:hypothetical protein [Oceanicola sp. 22II-s10i]OWU85169.1 hypothetical protein ATO6_09015 [Oceanicola sp. 22II-s10i]